MQFSYQQRVTVVVDGEEMQGTVKDATEGEVTVALD